MNKLRNVLAGFGAGLIVASITLQLTSSSGGPNETSQSSSGSTQLDESNVKKWAEENGYQLVKKEAKAASALNPAASPAASPSAAPAASPTASPASSPTSSPAASPSAARDAAVSPSPTPSPTSLQTPEISPPVTPVEPKSVTIPGGVSSTQVGEILADAGIVDKSAFDQALRQAQAFTKIRSGTYTFSPGEDPQNIIDELTKVPKFQ
ncbi:endolytic transglycosylase MltG [Paenibacillus contaminans]|uniref:Aminodeoxychorismate lyase n=1 Tax=Paenibacillus contaminans TaxID=450362 RepID=A0A329MSG1_9BACL|nr:endolytic transglycosylase MltG [Paenibacillus contaminans]RAV22734.1 hypothetical protein DQG23_00505 [Paenibacillus contaminans]